MMEGGTRNRVNLKEKGIKKEKGKTLSTGTSI
jgi:hypothetical protein